MFGINTISRIKGNIRKNEVKKMKSRKEILKEDLAHEKKKKELRDLKNNIQKVKRSSPTPLERSISNVISKRRSKRRSNQEEKSPDLFGSMTGPKW